MQHSVKELRSIGISPDIILCRTDRFLERSVKAKIALFCDVPEEAVITVRDVSSIYELPQLLNKEGIDDAIAERLNIWTGRPDLSRWEELTATIQDPGHSVRIAMVGKYVELTESYKSLNEALVHGGIAHDTRVEVSYVDSEKLEGSACESLSGVDGILVPHGFGPRGAEGKIHAIRFAREKRIPFFGICYGMQCAVIEIARHLSGLQGANSTEIDPEAPDRVIDFLPAQRERAETGGTMRLGAYPCRLSAGSLAARTYQKDEVSERHRHRYEFNLGYRETLEQAGLVLSGVSPDGCLVEIIELPGHPWFLGCQFHPEFKSTPFAPHPLFRGFVGAALAQASD